MTNIIRNLDFIPTNTPVITENSQSQNELFSWKTTILLLILFGLGIWAATLSANLNVPIARERGTPLTEILTILYSGVAFITGPIYLVYYLFAYILWNASLN